jgi:hypothetical protein
MEAIKPFIELLIGTLAGKYGNVLSVLAVMFAVIGALRTVFKLVPQLVKIVTDSTPSQADDAAPSNIENSKFYKVAVLILDYVASIKLPKK